MLGNSQIAQLLAREAASAKSPVDRALRRAARAAFMWPEEASTIVSAGRSLTELQGVGPYLEKWILRWLENPPEVGMISDLRSGFLSQVEAKAVLAKHPNWPASVRGDLQMHTVWSDGSGTIEEMAAAAQARNYQYIAITDHAKGLKIAGGINEAELQEQACAISAINEGLKSAIKPLRVLRSIELNLDVKGQEDLEPEALSALDLVLGAFHSALRKTEDQTERYLAALRNPWLHILGHPRGRIYNFRLGLRADWPRVFELAAKLDKAVEVDCYPDRQDLDVDLLRLARAAGVRISLGTDAHHPWQLQFIELGLAAALLAGIPQKRILNFMSAEQLLSWAALKR